uniref:Uncharacterized protein LOC111113508 n=1 Tax=Crassostrea virginica TaxID=6565 RepID=A0A8B8BW48_CRAVI|nr:uncharacterized protein LOC111113508 [Crassostrea virginica]
MATTTDEQDDEIKCIPETSKPIPPEFTAGQFNRDEVARLLGRVNIPYTEPEKRKTTLSLSSSVTKVRECSVQGVGSVWHISKDKSGRLWVSDDEDNLIQTDLQGNLLQKIQTSGESEGYHTAIQDGGLIYTDRHKKLIYRITPDGKITEFIITEDWEPLSIHSFRVNGDVLVGMKKDKEVKVTRYSKTGKEIQNIQRDNQGEKLGALGHILVCDHVSDTVHLLDQDGGFLTVILTPQQGIHVYGPRGVCVDDGHNLYVGQWFDETVTVYKYLE